MTLPPHPTCVRVGWERQPAFPRDTVSNVETELAWASGLFEGEGCATICRDRPRLALKMSTEASVRRFHLAVGEGKVYGPYGPYASQPNRSPHWLWVAEHEAGARVAAALLPMLSAPFAERVSRVFPHAVPRV